MASYSGFQKATTGVAILARLHHVLFIRSAALARWRLRCNSLKSAIYFAFQKLCQQSIWIRSVKKCVNQATLFETMARVARVGVRSLVIRLIY